ncbi:MAG TPA: lipocalin-like domain-containing protein [Burkholderiaceae bacterium]|nr:lipocalin-like domain-containing protein [Burkholderiaceae bacterium]
MYTPDSYMSARLMRPGRTPFATGDWFGGTDEEGREEAQGYIAYSDLFRKRHVDLRV